MRIRTESDCNNDCVSGATSVSCLCNSLFMLTCPLFVTCPSGFTLPAPPITELPPSLITLNAGLYHAVLRGILPPPCPSTPLSSQLRGIPLAMLPGSPIPDPIPSCELLMCGISVARSTSLLWDCGCHGGSTASDLFADNFDRGVRSPDWV